MSNKYSGMYLGIVVQNNDPEYRGRVKVYVPHVQANVYKNWFKEISDKDFKFLGGNIQSDLNKILPELKNILPWAKNAMPMVGSTGSGRYNAYDETGTISDSNKNDTIKPHEHETEIAKKYKLNDEHIGESPGKVFESHSTWVHDAFTNTSNIDEPGGLMDGLVDGSGDRLNSVNRPNIYAHNYQPKTYSNCAKGSFSIPNVGAHVWIFFQAGDALTPVVFGASHGEEDWKGIYDCHGEHGTDYPGTYENISSDEERVYTSDTETYRNKYVINQKGGSLEFVNTDNREILKMTHYSGSFLEFNNHTNISLATRNSQQLVLEDEYDTVKGFRNVFTGRDLDYIVRGDSYLKIGELNHDYHFNWRETMRPLADMKSLFETSRLTGIPGFGGTLDQIRSPIGQGYIPCPVCNDTDRIKYWSIGGYYAHGGPTSTHVGFNGASRTTRGGNSTVGYNPPRGMYRGPKRNSIQYEHGNTGEKTFYQYPYASSNELHNEGRGQIFGEKCPVCNGKGFSPSTMEGTWEPEKRKSDKEFETMLKRVTEELAVIESNLGLGGSEIINTAKHKVESIGLVMNDFSSIRTDPVGKMYRDKMIIHDQGVFASQKPSPLIETVHVDDLPGGTYTLNVSNRWNVSVGAGGISMKTFGRVEVTGTQVNISGEQVNIASKNEVNIDGGERLSIVGDIISIRQRDRGQVLVDSNLGVSQNVIIGGGLHVEGEISCHHLTAPVEMHETEIARIYSKLLKGLTFKCNIKGGSHAVSPHGTAHPSWTGGTITLVSDSNDDHVVDYGHSHIFKNAAMHLVDHNDMVRKTGKECNDVPSGQEPVRAKANTREVMSASEKVKKI